MYNIAKNYLFPESLKKKSKIKICFILFRVYGLNYIPRSPYTLFKEIPSHPSSLNLPPFTLESPPPSRPPLPGYCCKSPYIWRKKEKILNLQISRSLKHCKREFSFPSRSRMWKAAANPFIVLPFSKLYFTFRDECRIAVSDCKGWVGMR